MSRSFLIKKPGFCARCGHFSVVGGTVRALKSLGLKPHDVIIVTDIGCLGVIDKSLGTHTIHGLHGRSVALGAGLAMSLPPHKKVIVFIGDGGATIGLQHLLEAARLNVNLTVVVHNNMLYGMTGGQPSGLTPCGYPTRITPAPAGNQREPYDLCQLLHHARAPYVHRVTSEDKEELVLALQTALETEGFALVEVLEWCAGRNRAVREKRAAQLDRELKEWAGRSRWELGSRRGGEVRSPFALDRAEKPSLLAGMEMPVRFPSSLARPTAIVLGGRAGGRIRSAATYLSQGAVLSGLHVTQRDSYPVTVESGHSVSEVILSPDDILYMGIARPDIVIALFRESLPQIRSRLAQLTEQDRLYVNADLWDSRQVPATRAQTFLLHLRQAGDLDERYWAVMALAAVLRHTALYDLAAFREAVSRRKEFAPRNLAAIEASDGLITVP